MRFLMFLAIQFPLGTDIEHYKFFFEQTPMNLLEAMTLKYSVIPNNKGFILLMWLIKNVINNFNVFIFIVKLLILWKNEVITSFMSFGYEFIFILLDGLIMFIIMYLIRLLGNFMFKKESMGGGDIKMMTYISFILGWKLSIVVIFMASFLALPISIINVYRKDEHMLPFGPYLAVAALILFLLKVDFSTILSLLY